MNFDGFVRRREMPIAVLPLVGSLCRMLLEHALREQVDAGSVPEFPGYLHVGGGTIAGVCDATIGVHKLDGRMEWAIALYDEGDDTAPVLMLVGAQIDDFISQAQ